MGTVMKYALIVTTLLLATSAQAKWKPEYENAPQAYKDFYNNARDSAGNSCCMEADAANIELCREYFTNPTFRKALQNHLWETRAA